MRIKTCERWEITIFVSGEYNNILRFLQQHALKGACFSCEPTEYVFTHGREKGAKVTLMNYARFPKNLDTATFESIKLAEALILHEGMGSASVLAGEKSYFISRRDHDER